MSQKGSTPHMGDNQYRNPLYDSALNAFRAENPTVNVNTDKAHDCLETYASTRDLDKDKLTYAQIKEAFKEEFLGQ